MDIGSQLDRVVIEPIEELEPRTANTSARPKFTCLAKELVTLKSPLANESEDENSSALI